MAAPIAFAAGVVSFLSPCVLPLVPAYLSYTTGMSAADLRGDEESPRTREAVRRVVLGTLGFVAGTAVVFVSFGALFGSFGDALQRLADSVTEPYTSRFRYLRVLQSGDH